MGKSIIIGAGIAGLAAGCYAQMNGYKNEIYELHNIPKNIKLINIHAYNPSKIR